MASSQETSTAGVYPPSAAAPEHPSRARVLIVEDDDVLADFLLAYLGRYELAPVRVACADEGLVEILGAPPDLVILDLLLPGASGLELLRRVRPHFGGAILMLTASQSDADHVAGLELGADDFVHKPIEPRVLLARIRAQLRRLRGPGEVDTGGVLRVGALVVDVLAREVSVNETQVPLTAMEVQITIALAAAAGSVVSREDLYPKILGTEYDGLDRGMDVHVSRIRRKLQRAGLDPSRLKSVRGVGYLLAGR